MYNKDLYLHRHQIFRVDEITVSPVNIYFSCHWNCNVKETVILR